MKSNRAQKNPKTRAAHVSLFSSFIKEEGRKTTLEIPDLAGYLSRPLD